MSSAAPDRILFLDIETVSQARQFDDLSPEWQILWDEKTRHQRGEEIGPAEFYKQRAGILAEFGRVVCLSLGYFRRQEKTVQLRVKSLYGKNELSILQELVALMAGPFRGYLLCAHNGKEFDFPFLARRMVCYGLALPDQLNLAGKKPWEVPHLDTLELWKFGDRKNFTSLKLLAALFGLPTPKDDIDGSQVGSVFWEEDDLERIRKYCEKDVITLARVYLRLNQDTDWQDFTPVISTDDESA